MTTTNWRTINIDALDPESAVNFNISSLTPGLVPVSTAEIQQLDGQIRQLLRGGDAEGALRGALENAPYGGDDQAKVCVAPFCTLPVYHFEGKATGSEEIQGQVLLI